MAPAHSANPRRSRSRVWRWVLLSLAAVLLATVAWVGIRGLMARSELEAAIPLAEQIQRQVIDGNAARAADTAVLLDQHARAAQSLTSDFVWMGYELVPGLGPNLATVRELTDIVAQVSSEAIQPLTELAGGIDLADFKPVDSTVDLRPLIDAQPAVGAAADALANTTARVETVDTSQVLGVVRDAVTRLRNAVVPANEAVQSVDRAVTLLPRMLGAEGPRDYLLLFQNPAEVRATGGIPGALAVIHTENGRIELTEQASTADFSMFQDPVLGLPTDTRALYSDQPAQYIQDVTATPNFPLAATLAREMWLLQFGQEVDGVIAVDPFVLGYLLDVTGPLTLATGDQLTGANTVPLLLSEVYARYSEPADQDLFFAAAAAAAFSHVVSGAGDPTLLIGALAKAANEKRVLLWSAHEEDQSLLTGTTLAGELPVSDTDTQRFGVYQNDSTAAKMGYYLTTSIAAGSDNCRNDGRATMAVDITMTSTAPLDAATALPEYVTGAGAYGTPPGIISTIVYVYGPPGASNLGATGFDGLGVHPTEDEGYPVTSFQVDLAPGETKTVRVSMLSESPYTGPVEIAATPGVNTHVTVEPSLIC